MNRHSLKDRGILSPLRLPNSATPACLIIRILLFFASYQYYQGLNVRTIFIINIMHSKSLAPACRQAGLPNSATPACLIIRVLLFFASYQYYQGLNVRTIFIINIMHSKSLAPACRQAGLPNSATPACLIIRILLFFASYQYYQGLNVRTIFIINYAF